MTFFLDRSGQPILPLGLQTHNSSTGVPEMLEREIKAVKNYGGNLLEAPVYWFRMEKEPGQFDFADADDLIARCRANGLHLILLWFGVNKNGHPNYAPEWVKLHPETYAIAQGKDGGRVASMSPLCEATLAADKAAFARFMAHLKEVDGDVGTVIAVQIENEIGLANTDMDYRPEALAIYHSTPVPEYLLDVEIEDCGVIPAGTTWRSRFGRHAHETFMAWAHARFVEEMAIAGKAAYDLPLMINVMLGEQGFEEAGICYNSGAAVGRMLDVYKAAAPHVDLICPDMYVSDRERYRRVCGRYARQDNPLFVPESPTGGANAMHMVEAFADYGCIGMACFGAGRTTDAEGNLLPEFEDVALSMRTIANVAPLLIKYRGTGRVHALVQQEFMDKQYLRLPDYHIEAKFISASGGARWGLGSFLNPSDPANADLFTARGRALLIQTGEHEFFLAGCGVKVDFRRRPDPMDEDGFVTLTSRQCGTLNFLSVEEGHFEGDTWVCDRCRNGDESNFELFCHRGQAVRIRLNPA